MIHESREMKGKEPHEAKGDANSDLWGRTRGGTSLDRASKKTQRKKGKTTDMNRKRKKGNLPDLKKTTTRDENIRLEGK